MIYYTYTEKEISRLEVQEGELAIYTGKVDPRQANGLSSDSGKRNVYVFLWKDGQPQERCAEFHLDRDGLDVLDVSAGEEKYTFLRDHPSGYIRQIAGPAAPIVVANLGAIPLRVDTLLGKFTVHAGTILRLDENAPQREKKTVLLTVSSQQEQLLASAELWDGDAWRRLNIREEPADANEERGLTVLDGSAIVQYMSVNSKREIWMMDAPEPDPDYEICVTAQTGGLVTLRFDRADYREGRVVQRARTIFCTRWGEPAAYDLQKLRESRTAAEAYRCSVKLPGLPAGWESDFDLTEQSGPPDGNEPQAFLEDEDGPGAPPSEPGETVVESQREAPPPDTLLQPARKAQEMPVPEPPEDFPE